ncbi:hypothetical protein CSE45_0940 [Citreicella sp. SE45]|uniref:DUF3072 domain-containing protein n=1 Tax=Salipiger thiooxidans TaxID=282683 RepID=A0A1G7BVD6_9RHOB|nr:MULTISPECIES: pyrophosphatase [Salipiger]EEX14858.1 hypothetical protein CSE45_0940 [Citreicella sp. SE45]MAU46660.1 DUF3072 domain-containing protein [Salipiger sp.]NVK59232.1 DUF3072 domain-containing protein [Paracoccaceae bacterium]NIY95824.1 DUF3072 domain-containing protein [Salipiger sp. HF18]SDE30932.1 hypothetical protein SAMN04488105_102405 [Salipiger thiooxidans]
MNATFRPAQIDAALDVPPDPRQRMSATQEERLRELSERTGEPFYEDLTVLQAEQRIELLEAVAY